MRLHGGTTKLYAQGDREINEDPLLDDLKTLRATKGTSKPQSIAFFVHFPNCSNDSSTEHPTDVVTNRRQHAHSS